MTYKRKLIEVALPLAAINVASKYDKALKFGHPDNLHQWWARRPLPAARAVLFASLVDDPSSHPEEFPSLADQQRERDRLFSMLERLVPWEASDDEALLSEARAEIQKYTGGGGLPSILDPFGGGGAIPLEASRLGLPTFTGDLNPVAVLIQRASIEIPHRFSDQSPVNPDAQRSINVWKGTQGLADDVEYYGNLLRERVWDSLKSFYPLTTLADGRTGTTIAWLWARTVKSPDPSWPGHVPLVKSWVVARRPGRPIVRINPQIDSLAKTIGYEVVEGGDPGEPTVARGRGVCLATGTPIPADYIKSEAAAGRLGTTLLAVAVEGNNRRDYVGGSTYLLNHAIGALPEPAFEPTGEMSQHPQYMGTPRYGLDQWARLFTERQRLTLATFVEELQHVRTLVERDAEAVRPPDTRRLRDGGVGAAGYADAVATYLALAIDKLADLNNTLAIWKVDRECPVHLFGRQAVSMSWDFPEANPFSSSSGSWTSMIWGIKGALLGRGLTGLVGEPTIRQRTAVSQVESLRPVVISTDPPYYDNVPYSDLSDFFFVWLRRSLADVWPDECATLLTPKKDELVANHVRAGSWEAASRHFEDGMRAFFGACREAQDPRYPMTVFYAFKAAESSDDGVVSTGWEVFLEGLLGAGMTVTATWPMRTEGVRLRSIGFNALATSIVLACRPRDIAAPLATRAEFIGALRSEMDAAVHLLQLGNIAPVDLAQSAIGPGIAIFSRYARVVEANGEPMTVRSALALINEVLGAVLSGEEAEFDADTRFALTWFEQFGHASGPFGDADLLARAKDTTVAGVVQSGIIRSREGMVALVERKDLRADWDPIRDDRATVWEMTQYLIRALDASEVEAASLLARIGPGHGEKARQLAYLLYGICERRKWSDEAGTYNMLVTAWPEISRLAAAGPAAEATGSLF